MGLGHGDMVWGKRGLSWAGFKVVSWGNVKLSHGQKTLWGQPRGYLG